MIEQRNALFRLLQDDDPATLALIKSQLASRGVPALPDFRTLLGDAEPAVARHLREVIARIEAGDVEATFGRLCASFGSDGDLEEAAWRLAAVFFPGEDFAAQRDLLDEWGTEVSRRLRRAESEIDRIETLVEFLAHEARLYGNEEDYYTISNSLLPEVIDTRLGIPISLSLIYMLVGRRSGLLIEGVGLPGHFLIRYGQNFFDPFFGGRRIGLEECRLRLEQQNLKLIPAHLEPISSAQFLLRMLNNVRAIAEESEPPLAAKLGGWMEQLRLSVD